MRRRIAPQRTVLALLLVLTVVMLTLHFRTGVLDGLGGGLQQIVSVFQNGVRTLARPIENLGTNMKTRKQLREDVERLGRENQALRRQAETFSDLARENRVLRKLMEIEGSTDVETVRARVIGVSLSGLERSALIDKGRSSGISADSAVLVPEGLVGRVVWAGERTAKVLLVTDTQSQIGVKIGESGETGIVSGTGGSLLRLELVSRQALDERAVKPGSVVLTSGYQGGIFPPGIPIGRVEDVNLAERGTSYAIRVRPFGRLSRLDVMSVVLRSSSVQADPGASPAA